MKKGISPIFLAATLMVSACSTDDILQTKDDSEKTPVEFSMTDNTSSVVAVNGNTRAGFSASTGIVMQMVASKSGGTESKTTKTSATAEAGDKYSGVSFGTGNTRYWDDAYGRNTLLSICAVAVPGKTNVTALNSLPGENTWSETTTANSLTWSVKTSQTTTDIDNEDLVYSNNIQETVVAPNNVNGVCRWNFNDNAYPSFDGSDFTVLSPGQMKFALKTEGDTEGPGKFDKGNLNFVHALSRVTVKINWGNEFAADAAVSEPTLVNMPYTGTFSIPKGTFSGTTSQNITMASASSTETGVKWLCQSQVLPGYQINKTADTNFLHFKIGDNVYYVTQAKVFEALNTEGNTSKLSFSSDNNSIVMTQGQKYVLTITVSKTKVDKITATLADWTSIEGSSERNNAYLTFDFSDYSGKASSQYCDLYRAAATYNTPVTDNTYTPDYSWSTGYSNNKAQFTTTTSGTKTTFTTNWYWDDNSTFYHFRMVGKGSTGDGPAIQTESGSDYFTIASGETDGNYRWGAPMATGKQLTYSTTYGFDAEENDHHISKAIGATESTIHLTEVNTLAKIVVNLSTSDDASKVVFKKDDKTTKVSLVNIYTEGKVYMGNGLVAATGTRDSDTKEMKAGAADIQESTAKGYTYYVVPQALVEEKDASKTYVTFKIETPDGNVYYVREKLSQIQAATVTNSTSVSIGQTQSQAIDYWYPNCTYTYNLKLTKTGINQMTATLVPYTEITGANTDVTIED